MSPAITDFFPACNPSRQPRPISGVRKSVIINYVTEEWRAREQLAFPEMTVHG